MLTQEKTCDSIIHNYRQKWCLVEMSNEGLLDVQRDSIFTSPEDERLANILRTFRRHGLRNGERYKPVIKKLISKRRPQDMIVTGKKGVCPKDRICLEVDVNAKHDLTPEQVVAAKLALRAKLVKWLLKHIGKTGWRIANTKDGYHVSARASGKRRQRLQSQFIRDFPETDMTRYVEDTGMRVFPKVDIDTGLVVAPRPEIVLDKFLKKEARSKYPEELRFYLSHP
jgi:hypothetical protein